MRFTNLKIDNDYFKNQNFKYFIETMGCAMNENDSAKYAGIMQAMGIEKAEIIEEANLVLFNTCCVRENAEDKLFGKLGALKNRKLENSNFYIAIVGCMTQQEHIINKIKKSYPFVDIVLGTHSMDTFPDKLKKAIVNKKKTREYLDIDGNIYENVPIAYESKTKASVSIIYGCNNFCTYCIVPYVRGRERSRKLEDIVNDVKLLAQKGYKDITLLGQNVNSYGRDLEDKNSTFANLLIELNKIDGIEFIRFISPHPKDFTQDVIYAIRDCEKVAKLIHLPIQSGSTSVLKRMNRKYTKEQYLQLVDDIRKEIPEVSFTTDLIVGFPGETEEEFNDTLDVIKKVEYEQIYMFIYSKRKGTPAEQMPDQVDEDIKVERLEKVKYLHRELVEKNNQKFIGKTFDILVEGKSKTNADKLSGKIYNNKTVIFDGKESLIDTVVNVEITEQHLWYLTGKIKKEW